MTRLTPPLLTLLALAILASGCASEPSATLASPAAPAPSTTAAPDCRQLGADIANAERTRQAALEQEQGAWKAVVPFVVLARYASSKSLVEKTDRQLETLRSDFNLQGCNRDGY